MTNKNIECPVPVEWSNYATQSPYALEIVPWCLYCPVPYAEQYTIHFTFPPGYLYNPQAFLIRRIKLFGIPQHMLNARFQLRIGNKIFYDMPVWCFAHRKIQTLNPYLMMPPYVNFSAWISGIEPPPGLVSIYRPVTVALLGHLLRPIV